MFSTKTAKYVQNWEGAYKGATDSYNVVKQWKGLPAYGSFGAKLLVNGLLILFDAPILTFSSPKAIGDGAKATVGTRVLVVGVGMLGDSKILLVVDASIYVYNASMHVCIGALQTAFDGLFIAVGGLYSVGEEKA